MSTRKKWSAKARAAFFVAEKGICHLCNGKINGATEGWDLSHDIPLELGGADDATNIKVAHRKCHRAHTSTVDVPLIAKAKRRAQKNIGIRPPSQIKSAGFSPAPPQRRATAPIPKLQIAYRRQP